MRLAQPSSRQLPNMHNPKSRPIRVSVRSRVDAGLQPAQPPSRIQATTGTSFQTGQRKLVQNPPSGILRPIVNRDNLQVWVIHRSKRSERRGQFLFLVSRGKNQRNPRAIRIFCRREISNPRQPQQAPSHAKPVKNPEKSDETKEKNYQQVHGNWYRKLTSGYASTRCRERFRSWVQAVWDAH